MKEFIHRPHSQNFEKRKQQWDVMIENATISFYQLIRLHNI